MRKLWWAFFLIAWTLTSYCAWLIAVGAVQVRMARAECPQEVKKINKAQARVKLENLLK